jgi:hypothetical protein
MDEKIKEYAQAHPSDFDMELVVFYLTAEALNKQTLDRYLRLRRFDLFFAYLQKHKVKPEQQATVTNEEEPEV